MYTLCLLLKCPCTVSPAFKVANSHLSRRWSLLYLRLHLRSSGLNLAKYNYRHYQSLHELSSEAPRSLAACIAPHNAIFIIRSIDLVQHQSMTYFHGLAYAMQIADVFLLFI